MYALIKKAAVISAISLSIISIQSSSGQNILLAARNGSKSSQSFEIGDAAIYDRIVNHAEQKKLTQAPIGKIVQSVAQQFLGAEYQAGLLDRSLQETLVISLQKFDCLLFIETVLAIANNVAHSRS